LNLSKPKRQNLWHHANLRENSVKFRGVRGQGGVEALAATSPLVDPDSLPSWQMGANGSSPLDQEGTVVRRLLRLETEGGTCCVVTGKDAGPLKEPPSEVDIGHRLKRTVLCSKKENHERTT
jgi:hypothetical protein